MNLKLKKFWLKRKKNSRQILFVKTKIYNELSPGLYTNFIDKAEEFYNKPFKKYWTENENLFIILVVNLKS